MQPAALLTARALIACAIVLLGLASATGPSQSQTLPIPGIPGGLGGVQTPETSTPDANGAQTDRPPQEQGSPETSAPATGPSDPTQALIDILRDDAAREALIRELEASSSAAAPESEAPPPETVPSSVATEPVETFGDRAISATRLIGSIIVDELDDIWLRIQRIPNTVMLSGRMFENGALQSAIAEIFWPAIYIYGTLLVLRRLLRPFRRRIAAAGETAGWINKLLLRLMSSALDIATLPVAVFLGVIGLVTTGFVTAGENDEPILTDAQALFLNAFFAVEVARTLMRMVLSPQTEALRMVPLPDAGARHLWHVGWILIYVTGYGQLLFVPVIGDGVSVFVGRAAAAVLSTVVVTALIFYVLSQARRVGRWLCQPESDSALVVALRPLALRWHWPVLVYLTYVLLSVLTRPGNVLLPLLQDTAEVALIAIVGSIVLSALTERAAQRVTLPGFITERLPLLEERVNQIRPAYLTIVRFFIFFVILLTLLSALGWENVGGFVSGAVLEQFSSGLFSVLLIVGLLSLLWLAMTSWVDYRLNPFVGSVPTPRETTLLTLLKNAVTVALIIIGIITSLAQLGMNVGPLIASAGVIGLAISFGAQKMVEDIFSGIFIQAENAMNVGDVVDAGGTVGTVEKLTVRSVTLRDLSGVVHVIPFSSAAKISNYMRDFAYYVADIGVAYREDVDDVRAAMHDAFEKLRSDEEKAAFIIGDLEWFGLNAFGPSELVMRARIKTVPGQQWGIGRAYNAIVKDVFDERGIEIPFPHQTLYFGEDKTGKAPPLHLQMSRKHAARQAEAEHTPSEPPQSDPTVTDEGTAHRETNNRDTENRETGHREPVAGADHPDEDGR
ncbi:MAG: mechanosensitive ion channel domain-containing protein [Pseudomonadota bacterium]